jgi:hypothetical protein
MTDVSIIEKCGWKNFIGKEHVMIQQFKIFGFMYKVTILLICLNVLILTNSTYTGKCYGRCAYNIKIQIEKCENEIKLQQLITGKVNEITVDCYIDIGDKFLFFFAENLTSNYLIEAIRYLSYAFQNIKKMDPDYSRCQRLLNEAEKYQQNQNTVNRSDNADLYLHDPFHNAYPEKIIQVLNENGRFSKKTARINQVNELVTQFQKNLNLLKTEQTLKQSKKTLSPIIKLANAGINTDIPEIKAVKYIHQYFVTFDKIGDSVDSCSGYKKAYQYIRMAQEIIPELSDSLQADCKHQWFCLNSKLKPSLSSMMPDEKHPEKFGEQLIKCEEYQHRYSSLNNCRSAIKDDVFGNFALVIDDLIAFYRAYHFLKKPDENTHPAMPLHKFMKHMNNKNDMYAKKLFNLAGYYNALYFYQQSRKLLYSGPTLNDWESSLTQLQLLLANYHIYHHFYQNEHDIQQDCGLLKDFFACYQSNPKKAKVIAVQMIPEIKSAWKIDHFLHVTLFNE